MPIIRYEGKDYDCPSDEILLDSLAQQGVKLPSSCKSGACQTCLTRAISGTPPAAAQKGLKSTLAAQGYFLACQCKPESDMEIGLATISQKFSTRLIDKMALNESVIRLRLSKPDNFDYHAGQFINLIRPSDELTRSYSLASLPSDDALELHIKRVPKGAMSGWLFDHVETGEELAFYGPSGDCFYLPEDPEQPLLLVGAGTGLAPLYGIIQDALQQEHRAPIHLFHGSLAKEGLYLIQTLRELDNQYAQFHYTPCVLHGDSPPGGMQGNIGDLPVQALGSLSGYRVFLCGDPAIVRTLRQNIFMAGASMQAIHSDPFEFAAS